MIGITSNSPNEHPVTTHRSSWVFQNHPIPPLGTLVTSKQAALTLYQPSNCNKGMMDWFRVSNCCITWLKTTERTIRNGTIRLAQFLLTKCSIVYRNGGLNSVFLTAVLRDPRPFI